MPAANLIEETAIAHYVARKVAANTGGGKELLFTANTIQQHLLYVAKIMDLPETDHCVHPAGPHPLDERCIQQGMFRWITRANTEDVMLVINVDRV